MSTYPGLESSQPGDSPQIPLSYQGSYPCPICRHGQVSELVLMDAFACNFCRHIFTVNLTSQSIQVEDSSQAFAWQWRGDRWLPFRQDPLDLGLLLWVGAFLLTTLPSGLIGLSYYTFPPLPDTAWYWFPLAWAGLTFLAHAGFVVWLLAESHQWPLYVTLKVWLQRRQGQL